MRLENVPPSYVLIAAGVLGLTACSESTPPGGGPDVEPISEAKDSVAIRIETDGTGNCNFDPLVGNRYVAALNNTDYANGAMCGACAEVEGPSGQKVIVRVVDSCAGCTGEEIGLSEQSLDTLGAQGQVQASIRWRYVSCPVAGPVQYRFKEDSSPYWVAIQVRNHRLPIQKLEWDKGGTWVDVPRQPYNYFVEPSGMGPGPIRLRVTAADGQQLEDTLPQVIAATVVVGAAQFQAP
jgi:expansin (peptidoglycan-binding protein)